MAKALVIPSSAQFQEGKLIMSVSVAVDVGVNFGTNLSLDTTQTPSAILSSAKQEVIKRIREQGGPTLAEGDVIVWGGVL